MVIQTDMNQRERRKYADQLRKVGEAATKAAEALEAEADEDAMIQILSFSLIGGSLQKELLEIYKDAADASKASSDLEKGESP